MAGLGNHNENKISKSTVFGDSIIVIRNLLKAKGTTSTNSPLFCRGFFENKII